VEYPVRESVVPPSRPVVSAGYPVMESVAPRPGLAAPLGHPIPENRLAVEPDLPGPEYPVPHTRPAMRPQPRQPQANPPMRSVWPVFAEPQHDPDQAKGHPWPELLDDSALWAVPAAHADQARVARLQREQGGVRWNG
jgi:hypothetical protein